MIFRQIDDMMVYLKNTTATVAIYSHPLALDYGKKEFDISIHTNNYHDLDNYLDSGRAIIPPVRILSELDGKMWMGELWTVKSPFTGKWMTHELLVGPVDYNSPYKWLSIPENNKNHWHYP